MRMWIEKREVSLLEEKRALEEIWAESIRRANQELRAENAREWQRYHESQARSHEHNPRILVRHDQREAQRYRKMLEEGAVPKGGLRLGPGFAEVGR